MTTLGIIALVAGGIALWIVLAWLSHTNGRGW